MLYRTSLVEKLSLYTTPLYFGVVASTNGLPATVTAVIPPAALIALIVITALCVTSVPPKADPNTVYVSPIVLPEPTFVIDAVYP